MIGNEVAKYYQDEGFNALHDKASFQIDELIARLKAEGRAIEPTAEIVRRLKPLYNFKAAE